MRTLLMIIATAILAVPVIYYISIPTAKYLSSAFLVSEKAAKEAIEAKGYSVSYVEDSFRIDLPDQCEEHYDAVFVCHTSEGRFTFCCRHKVDGEGKAWIRCDRDDQQPY